MTIKDDIDYQLKRNYRRSSASKRSYFAYGLLTRIDQVRGELKRGMDLDGYQRYGFVPPSVREIVRDYINNRGNTRDTLQALSQTKRAATIYLKKQGCNPELARRREKQERIRQRKHISGIMKRHREIIGGIERTLECLSKIVNPKG